MREVSVSGLRISTTMMTTPRPRIVNATTKEEYECDDLGDAAVLHGPSQSMNSDPVKFFAAPLPWKIVKTKTSAAVR